MPRVVSFCAGVSSCRTVFLQTYQNRKITACWLVSSRCIRHTAIIIIRSGPDHQQTHADDEDERSNIGFCGASVQAFDAVRDCQ